MNDQKSGFHHSIKVPRQYKSAAKIVRQVKENGASVKQLVYQERHNVQGLLALVAETLKHGTQLETLFQESQILEKEDRLDPWLARVLITELFWGKGRLGGDSKPVQTVLKYQPELSPIVAKLNENFPVQSPKVKMNSENEQVVAEPDGVNSAFFLPAHTRRIGIVLLWFLAFSLAMFTLPFVAFFGVRSFLKDKLDIDGFKNTVWSVIAAVVTVNAIIVVYALKGYYEPEYDEDGNLIDQGAPISKKQN